MSDSATNPGRPLGRPRALDTTKREIVIALVTVGRTRTEAARYLGVSPQTVLNTAVRDAEFARRLKQAAAEFEVGHLRNVHTASGRSWHASAWALARIDPGRFADPSSQTARRHTIRRFTCEILALLVEEVADPVLREQLVDGVREASQHAA